MQYLLRGFLYTAMIETLYSIFLEFPNICTDTRKAGKNALFFALKGSNFNGNEFAAKALESGCVYAVIDEEKYKVDDRYILVEDVLKSLQQLARYHREKLKIPFIGITGSNGKTTTKELMHAILQKKYQSYATQGNLNNHIGVPLSILAVTAETEMAIIEMGANHVREIAALCRMAKPDYGIITNIGKAHLEGFGGLEGVIKAKKELYEYIGEHEGVLFVHAGNPLLKKLSKGQKIVTYGFMEGVDTVGKMLSGDFAGLQWKQKGEQFFGQQAMSGLIGAYNLENLLAAVCIGQFFEVSDVLIREAIEQYMPSNNRSQLLQKGTNRIYLDAYNANPVSMKLAIDNFSLSKEPNKIAILGDMRELGIYSAEEHKVIINLLANATIDQVILIGKEFSKANHFPEFTCFENVEEAKKYLSKHSPSQTGILLKGSRGIELEKLLEVL